MTDERIDITKELYPELSFESDDLPVMDLEERKRRLSRFARETHVTPDGRYQRTSNIQSIQELNKMDNVYGQDETTNTAINILSGVIAKLRGYQPPELGEGRGSTPAPMEGEEGSRVIELEVLNKKQFQ